MYDPWLDGSMCGWMDQWVDGWMDQWVNESVTSYIRHWINGSMVDPEGVGKGYEPLCKITIGIGFLSFFSLYSATPPREDYVQV